MQKDFWLEEFQKRVGLRLRIIFEKDLHETPRSIIEKVEELRKKETQLLARKPK